MTICSACGKELLCLPCSLNVDCAFVLRPDKEILVLQTSPSYAGSVQSLAEELSSAQIPGLTVIVLPPHIDALKERSPQKRRSWLSWLKKGGSHEDSRA